MEWDDLSRGAARWVHGPDELATRSGIDARMSGQLIEDEGLFVLQHKAWQQHMQAALKRKEQK